MSTAEQTVVDEGGEVMVLRQEGGDALDLQLRGEIDVQIATAKNFPRSLTRYKDRAIALATFSKEIASGCHYSLKRGGKIIEGQTVRLAEIVVASYGNLHAAKRIVREGEKTVTAQAAVWDLETNARNVIEYTRRITYANGTRYNDDMVTLACNDAMSRSYRNAVFATVPAGLREPIYRAALDCAFGDAKSLPARRKDLLKHFGDLGVKPHEVLEYCGAAGPDDLTLADIRILGGVANAIASGETTVDLEFRAPKEAAPAPAAAAPKAAKLAADLEAKLAAKQ
jgi:hypothetical protein